MDAVAVIKVGSIVNESIVIRGVQVNAVVVAGEIGGVIGKVVAV